MYVHIYMCVCIHMYIYMCLCIHIYIYICTHTCVYIKPANVSGAGWRRPIGCLKLQVIFRKRATNYWALLRKMTYKDKVSYDSTPLCTCPHSHTKVNMYVYIHARMYVHVCIYIWVYVCIYTYE